MRKVPCAEEVLAKAELAQKIIDAIRVRHLTQVQAGRNDNREANKRYFLGGFSGSILNVAIHSVRC
jgi:hypothetical protein